MVVDAVLINWVTVVVEDMEEQGERGKEGRHQTDLFYADNDMVALYNHRWIQGTLNTLVGLFDRVGLQNILVRQLEWSAAPSRRRGISRRRRAGGGSRGKAPRTGSD